MSQCTAITQGGGRCQKLADGPNGMCWTHDPINSDQRRRNAYKGGRGKANQEVRLVKEELKQTITAVKAGELDRNTGAVAIQGYRALQGYLELERRVKETDEFEARLAELERGPGRAG